MSRTKEAVVVLLDAGPSMRAPLRERVASSKLGGKRGDSAPKTRFDAAVSAVEGLLQQKLLFKPKDEVGVVVYGSEETNNQLNEEQGASEYTNVSVLQPIDAPTLGVWEQLRRLEPARASANAKVDILDGLIVALDLLFRRTDGKKYDKRLLVITDAAAKITDAGDVDSVVQMIQSMGVKLQIVGIDFRHTTDDVKKDESGAAAQEPPAPTAGHDSASDATNAVKIENEKMLVSIAAEVGGEVNSVSKRVELLAQGMKKTVALTTKFRGSLEIGQDLGIPLFCYLKTKVATLPTLAKESQTSFDKDTAGKVKMDRRYTSPQHPDEDVAPEQQVKAYRYGMEKVPFSSADVEFFKFQTEKSLKLLGFLAKEQLSLAKFVGGTDVFVAEPGKPEAAQCLAALIDAMLELNQVAIARFVARKNAAPKIVALIPHAPDASDGYYALWAQQLPFEEDLRTYEFAPLKTAKHRPSASQQAAADKLVESLSVRDDKAESVGACLNPVLWRFFHAVSDRAFDDDAPLPPLPAYVETCLSMDEARKQRIGGVIQAFGDAFQLKEAVKTTHERKKKAFWSDVAAALPSLKDESSSTAAPARGAAAANAEQADSHDAFDDDAGSDLDLDDLLDSGDVTSVGSMNPVADFEALVDMAKTQRAKLVTAVSGMEARIESFLTSSASFHRKAVQCLAHFRARSAALHYAAQFNDFLSQLKSKVGGERSDAWRAVEREGVTLLSTDDDPSLSVTPAQARAFLYGEEHLDVGSAAASLPTQVEAMEQEDDMFAEFE